MSDAPVPFRRFLSLREMAAQKGVKLADSIHSAVALRRIFCTVKQGISGLIAFQIEDAQCLPGFNDANKIITGSYKGPAYRNIRF